MKFPEFAAIRIISWIIISLFSISLPVFSQNLGNVVEAVPDKQGCVFRCDKGAVRLEVWSDRIVRLWMNPAGKFDYYNDYNSYMIEPGLKAFKSRKAPEMSKTPEGWTIRTRCVEVRIKAEPFTFSCYTLPDKHPVLQSKPGTFDVNHQLFMERDFSGAKEAFYGLQAIDARSLSLRDQVVQTRERNGFGWSSSLLVSSAGYAVFYHNEYAEQTVFDLKDPVRVANAQQKGEMDFFFLFGDSYPSLLKSFTDLTGRTPMLPKKLFGFQYLVQGTPIDNVEAFADWRKRGYAVDNCITFTDYPVITEGDVSKVKAVAEELHGQDSLFGFYFDLKPFPGTFKDLNPEPHDYPYQDWSAFKKVFHERLVAQGADWFWIDETDQPEVIDGKNDARFPFHLYRAMIESFESSRDQRGVICGRGGYTGCQRFGYSWTGDIGYGLSGILSNLTLGMVGYSLSTLDMSGAEIGHLSEDQYLNGVRTSFMNPLSQCNNWIPNRKPSHRPWEWSLKAERVFHRYMDLHYQLVPYFYQLTRESFETGLPVWRSLPFEDLKNTALADRDEILIGSSLLYAPLYEETVRKVMLPPGSWMHYFSGKMIEGGKEITFFSADPYDAPLYVRMGSIIPMMEPVQKHMDENPNGPRILDLYPTQKRSETTLYEDDGKTRAYLQGAWSKTLCEMGNTGEDFSIVVHKSEGSYRVPQRSLVLKILRQTAPNKVVVLKDLPETANWESLSPSLPSDELLPFCPSEAAFKAANQGWGYFIDDLTRTCRLWIKLPDDPGKTIGIRTEGAKPALLPEPAGRAIAINRFATAADWSQVPGKLGAGSLKSLSRSNPSLMAGVEGKPAEWRITSSNKQVVLSIASESNPKNPASLLLLDQTTGRVQEQHRFDAGTAFWGLQYEIRGTVILKLTGFADAQLDAIRVKLDAGGGLDAGEVMGESKVTFTGNDTSTKGNWMERYGSRGSDVAGQPRKAPVDLLYENKNPTFVWKPVVESVAGVKLVNNIDRTASCYYSAGKKMELLIGNKSRKPRSLSFYFWPYEPSDRKLVIRATNPNDGAILDERIIENADQGVYYNYTCDGLVRFQVEAVEGVNAIVNAVFFND